MLHCRPLNPHQLQKLDSLDVFWVNDDNSLDNLLDEIEKVDLIALDTEFIKKDSFFPRLALIQVNTGNAIYLVDAPKLDLYDFWHVIADVPTLVLHACSEDLGLFYLLSDLPALENVFDTQVGLGFLLGELSYGYQKSLQDTLNIQIDKGESQSDWLKRPLSFEQEQYACNDVRYLIALYDEVCLQLREQNLLEFAKQDSLHLAKSLYLEHILSDDQIYLSVADYRYSRQQLAMLQALCEWREQLARSINRPRTYILRPQALQEIIEQSPLTLRQLGFTSTKPDIIRMYGNEMLKIIQTVKKTDEKHYPPSLPMPYRNLSEEMQTQLQIVIDEHAEKLGVPQNVLIRKKWFADLHAYIINNQAVMPVYLLSWRKDWIFNTLIPAFDNLLKEREKTSTDVKDES